MTTPNREDIPLTHATPAPCRIETRRARITVLPPPIGEPDTISVEISDDLEPMEIVVEPWTDAETKHHPEWAGGSRFELNHVPHDVALWISQHADQRMAIESWRDRPEWKVGDSPGDGYAHTVTHTVIGELEVRFVEPGFTDRNTGSVIGAVSPAAWPGPPPVQRVRLGWVRVTPAHLPADTPDGQVMDLRRPKGSEHLDARTDPAPTQLLFLPDDKRPMLEISPVFDDDGELTGFAGAIAWVPQRLFACIFDTNAGHAVRIESWTRVPQPDPELHAKYTVFKFEPDTWEIDGSTGPITITGPVTNVDDPDVPDGRLAMRLQVTDEPLPPLTPLPA